MKQLRSILVFGLLFSSTVLVAQVLDQGNFMIGSTIGFSVAESNVKLQASNQNEEGEGPLRASSTWPQILVTSCLTSLPLVSVWIIPLVPFRNQAKTATKTVTYCLVLSYATTCRWVMIWRFSSRPTLASATLRTIRWWPVNASASAPIFLP